MSDAIEVCVIGSGAGGAVAAWALVNRGIRVRLLETGPRFDPSQYPTHDPAWPLKPSPFEAVAFDPQRKSYESAPPEALDPNFKELTSYSPTVFAGPPRNQRMAFHYSRALGVGGSTLHYQGEAHRFPEHAFRMRTERGVAADWPISYQDLAPYYERIEQLIGVAGEAGNPFKAKRGAYPYPAHPLSALSRRVKEVAGKHGLHVLPNPVAILPEEREGRSACHYCNGCSRGCAVRAKGSVDVSVIPAAEATGKLEIVTGFHASRFEMDENGHVKAVVGFDASGNETRVEADHFVLSTGAIETPRILLNSVSKLHPVGLGNAQDQVGRYLMELLYVSIGGSIDPALKTHIGIPVDSKIWNHNGASGRGSVVNGYVLSAGAGAFLSPASHALHAAKGFGVDHRTAMQATFGGAADFNGIAEQLPRPSNRVTLSESADRFGVPLARVNATLDKDDLQVLKVMREESLVLAQASGMKEAITQVTAYDVPNASHAAGTCRMGRNPEESVVNEWGRVHGVPNLVIADASVLVTQGSGDAPSLTIEALALRAAEHLADEKQKGEHSSS